MGEKKHKRKVKNKPTNMKNKSGNQHQSIRESKLRGYGECKETIFSDIKAKKFLDLKKDLSLKIERAYQGKTI